MSGRRPRPPAVFFDAAPLAAPHGGPPAASPVVSLLASAVALLGLSTGMSFTVLCAGPARADGAARGVAGAYSLRARGADAPAWNPATLAWSAALDLNIAAVDGGAHNNAFSLGDYRRWNGAVLDEQDKEAILASIPGEFLRGGFEAQAEGPGAAWRGWALTTAGRAAGAAALPKELGRLAFSGNEIERSYDLGGTSGDATAWSELRLSHGRALGTVRVGSGSLDVAGGLSLKGIRGWAHGEVTHAAGSVVTTSEGITGAAEVTGRRALGGEGFACDLGVAARTETWRFGLALTNALSRLSWTRSPEEHTQRARADRLTLDDLDEGDDDDRFVTADTSRAIASFITALPAEVAVAAARRWRGFDWEADLRQGFTSQAGSSTTPRLALGVSRRVRRFLEGRAGLALGGAEGPLLAAGVGFAGGRVRFDLGVASALAINVMSPRGAAAGVSLGLCWDDTGD